jgi:hypothetical protein
MIASVNAVRKPKQSLLGEYAESLLAGASVDTSLTRWDDEIRPTVEPNSTEGMPNVMDDECS